MKVFFVLALATAPPVEPGADSSAIIQSRASANFKAFETAAVISAAPTRPRPENAASSARLVPLS